jgi:hypothetical protein
MNLHVSKSVLSSGMRHPPVDKTVALLPTCCLLVSNLASCSTLKIEAVRFSETAINFHQTTRHDFEKGSHHRGNGKYDRYKGPSDDFAKSFITNSNSFLVFIYRISELPDGWLSRQMRFTIVGHGYVREGYRVFLLGSHV